MVRVFTLLSLIGLIVGNATAPLEAEGHEPLQLGSRLELFVDDFLIERTKGLTKRLHAPVSAGKFLELNKPWEGNTCFYTTVFRDGDRYLMYYRGSSDPTATPPSMLEAGEEVIPKHPEFGCVLVSSDGIRWERPSVGIHEFNGSRDNNIVWTGRALTTWRQCSTPNRESRKRNASRPCAEAPCWLSSQRTDSVGRRCRKSRSSATEPSIP
ncbi:MAG: hypothetical protein OXT71_20010 [Acidobacteriota bacterium]|nr:hypothetical protein [Acidobacteriota bacterium]